MFSAGAPTFQEDIRMRNHERRIFHGVTIARPLAIIASLVVASTLLAPRAAAQGCAPPQALSAADSARIYSAPNSVWYAQHICRVLDEGTRVVLTDGSVWEVYLPNRPDVDTWKPGDLLVVRVAAVAEGGAGYTDYDYTMYDGRTGRLVWVRLIGDWREQSSYERS